MLNSRMMFVDGGVFSISTVLHNPGLGKGLVSDADATLDENIIYKNYLEAFKFSRISKTLLPN